METKPPIQSRPAGEPAEGLKPQPPVRKAYRKPVLKRLGLLKAVAGSGLKW